MRGFSDRNRTEIVAAALVTALIGALSGLGLLDRLSCAAWDTAARLRGRLAVRSPYVLLVEIPLAISPVSEHELRRLVRELDESGARRVVILFVPQVSADFFHLTAGGSPLVFGRRLQIDREAADGRVEHLEPLPAGVREMDVAWGVAAVAPSADGIHREQRARLVLGDRAVPAVEIVAAGRDGEESLRGPSATGETPVAEAAEERGGRFGLDLRAGTASLPAVPMSRILAGGGPVELIAGRTVLIGEARGRPDLGIRTARGELVSPLVYHGHALDTLLGARTLRSLPFAVVLLVVALLAAVSAAAYQRLCLRSAQLLGAGLIVFAAGGYAIAFLSSNFRLPVVEMALTPAGVTVLSWWLMARKGRHALRSLVDQASGKLRHLHPAADRFYTTGDPWAQIVAMVDQFLDYRRLVFFERVEGTNQLHEVEAAGCSLDAVAERRRDLSRAPYSTALEQQGPTRVTSFLHPAGGEERQILVPLVFGSQVQGFWALGLDLSRAGGTRRLDRVIRLLARAIAERFFHRKHVAPAPGRRRTASSEVNLKREIRSVLEWLDGRRSRAEDLLRSLRKALVVYDLLGHVVDLSDEMASLLKEDDIPQDIGVLELIATLTSTPVADVRQLLREALVKAVPVTLPARLGSRPETVFELRLDALRTTWSNDETVDTVRGFVVELDDVTQLTARQRGLRTAWRHLESRLERLLPAAETLRGRADSDPFDAARLFAKARAVFDQEGRLASERRHPVDVTEVLEQVLGGLDSLFRRHAVELEIDRPRELRSVLATPLELGQVFKAVFQLLGDDMREGGGVLRLRIRQTADITSFEFTNQGYGLPIENLDPYLGSREDTFGFEVENLHQAVQWTRGWKGTLDVDSQVGEGIRVHLEVETFL